MTNKEAINELAEMGNMLQIIPSTRKGQALKMAIKALNAEPISPKEETCVDSDALLMRAIRESLAIGGIHGADATAAMVQVLKTIWRFDLIPPCCRDEVSE